MTDPYGPYRPAPFGADDVEYDVVSPPLPTLARGYESGYGFESGYGYERGYGYGPAPAAVPPAPAAGRPDAGTTAAVLALVEAGLLTAGAIGWVAVLGAGDAGVAAGATLGALSLTAVAALLVVGGLGLLRGVAARLLTAATWAELGLLTVLTLSAVAALAADRSGGGAAGVLLAGLAVAAAPVVRLVLLGRAPVRAWLAATAPPGAPVWSPARGRWVPPRRPAASAGVLAAVAGSAAALAVVTVVVSSVGSGSGGVPRALDPYADGARGSGTYAGYSSWGDRYYQDGRTLPAPPTSSHLYDPEYDPLARDCAEGDMYACDDLYYVTPIGDFYEWFGSSCAGRIDHETTGGCVDLLGPEAD